MATDLGAGIWAVVLGVAAAAAAGAVAATRALAGRAHLDEHGRRRAVLGAGALVGGWLALWTVLGAFGFFRARSEGFPLIVIGIAVPLGAATVLLRRSPTFRRLADVAPQSWLVGVQSARTLGGIFLVIHAWGRLPAEFAYPAGIGDVLVGIAAVPVAWALAKRRPGARGGAITFNIAGLADFVVAVGTGFLAAPSPVRALFTNPSTEIMTVLPLVLVPVFLVPAWTIVHVLSLRGLLRSRTALDEVAPRPVPQRTAAARIRAS
jgi:hypothetical protein